MGGYALFIGEMGEGYLFMKDRGSFLVEPYFWVNNRRMGLLLWF